MQTSQTSLMPIPTQRTGGRLWPRRAALIWGLGLTLILSLAAAGCNAAATPVVVPAEPIPLPQFIESPTEPAAEPMADASTQPPLAATVLATASPAVLEPTAPPVSATEPLRPEPSPVTVEVPEATVPASVAAPQTPAPGQGEGVAFVVGAGSEATFTVNEKLNWLDLPNDAVMRTSALSGQVYLDGQPSVVEIDLHSLTSDSDRRDRYVRERMFPNSPVATFTVADLGQLPNPFTVGEVVAKPVEGRLTIRGITKSLIFDVEARLDPGKLFILGRAAFTWDELEIPPPNIPGRIQVKDEVRVEVLLSATPTLAGGQ